MKDTLGDVMNRATFRKFIEPKMTFMNVTGSNFSHLFREEGDVIRVQRLVDNTPVLRFKNIVVMPPLKHKHERDSIDEFNVTFDDWLIGQFFDCVVCDKHFDVTPLKES